MFVYTVAPSDEEGWPQLGPKIFISYRRNDAPGSAGRLYDRLAEAFPRENIFIDVDGIAPGIDFVKALDEAIGQCDVLLAIIGNKWLEARNVDGRQRLEDPEDFVRMEIETALERDIRVVPVLVEGARMPAVGELPQALHLLSRLNAIELTHARFLADTDRLARALTPLPDPADQEPPAVAANTGVRKAPEAAKPFMGRTVSFEGMTTPAGAAKEAEKLRELPSRGAGRRSIGGSLDRFFTTQSQMTVWGIPVVTATLLIWCSSFFSIDFIRAPWIDVATKEFATCASVGKQVGLWTSPNWSVVYLILFPIYLILISILARNVRRTISECVDSGMLARADGSKPDEFDIHDELDRELAANNKLFYALILVVIAVAAGGWWTSAGQPLLEFNLRGQTVNWATIIIVCGLENLQYEVFVYTVFAYAWMGLALFVYLACLILGFIYASFISRLTAGAVHVGGGPSSYYVVISGRRRFLRHLRDVLLTYFLACCFGLLAGYAMRLQATYLFASEESLGSFWFQDALLILRELGLYGSNEAGEHAYQLANAKDQTAITGFFISGITFVFLLGSGWMIHGAFRNASETDSMQSLATASREPAMRDVAELESVGFVPTVLPFPGAMFLAVTAILVGTIFTNLGFLVLSVVVAASFAGAFQHRLKRSLPTRGGKT